MTPIQKAKEIFLAAWEYWRISAVESPSLTFDNWTKTDEGKQLLSGEDWISVDDRLPESGKRVIFSWVTYNKRRTSLGFYATKFSVVDDNEDNRDGEYSEYNEETDQYYYPVGWVEVPMAVEYTADVSNVTHWQPLPEPPKP